MANLYHQVVTGARAASQRFNWRLVAILLFAWIIRFYRLDQLPNSLHSDEVVNAYVGRYILENGQDLWGHSWPVLHFDKFGDYPPVLPMYLSGLGTYIGGMSELGGRWPIAFLGGLIVLPVYGLARFLFERRLALWSARLMAALPWHIIMSRATSEGVVAATVFMTGLWLAIKAWQSRQLKFFLISLPLFGLTYLLYPGYRLIVPLIMLGLVALYQQKLRWLAVLTTCLFLVITLLISQTVWGRGRFDQTSVFFYNHQVQNRLEQYVTSFARPSIWQARLFHNKPLGFAREVAFQYSLYLSPSFLFARGGLPLRYSIPDQGLFFYTVGLIMALGLLSYTWGHRPSRRSIAFTVKQKRLLLFLLWVLAVSILPAALTVDDSPNVHRALLMSVLAVFFIPLALKQLDLYRWRSISLIWPLSFLMLMELAYFWHQYTDPTTQFQALVRGDDKKQQALYLIDQAPVYQKVFASSQESLPFYYLFYSQNFDPNLAGQLKTEMKFDQINGIEFLDTNCPSYFFSYQPGVKTLVIDRSECDLNHYLTELKMIYRVNQTEAFRVLTPQAGVGKAEFEAAQLKIRGEAKL